MNIGIDGNEANVVNRVGIGEYSHELLRQFSIISSGSGAKIDVYLKNHPLEVMPTPSENFKYTVFGPSRMWTQFALPLRLFAMRNKPDIFFSPSHYAPRFSPVPTCISIMDLSYHYYPGLFAKKDLYQLKNWTLYSAKKASLIFTISKASKSDIIDIYNVAEDKIIVTYPGIKPFTSLSPQIYTKNMLSKFQINNRYFLFVGTLQPRKNIVRLIEAFSKISSKGKDHDVQLVIVGRKGWLYEEILKSPAKFGVAEKVKFLDFVSDEQLPALYKHAIGFVFPSLYEGFGLPVLEAMKHDCPVITSNTSSLPEAGGDAVLYVDPLDVEDIFSKMKRLLDSEDTRKKLIEKGKEHIKSFSWSRTADQTLNALRQIS